LLFAVFLGLLTTSINPIIIQYISVALFFVFGLKMVFDGLRMTEEEALVEYEEAQKVVSQKEV